jgi:putative membrane protein
MKKAVKPFAIKLMQGSLIGVGAVLPGISGGVLCVAFGIYKTIMEFLASPFRNFKTHLPKLIPIIIGGIIGFLGIANLLSFLLDRYPAESTCVFIGLISGMLPSLFREAGEKGRSKNSYISMAVAMVLIFALLISLKVLSVIIAPNFLWYLFCGVCLALSVIAPGLSFSTLLMPLGLYTPFVEGIGHLKLSVLIPGAMGALVTVILFAKLINALFNRFYSVSFHAIIGIVIAATVMIIPFESFAKSVIGALINTVCIVSGVAAALLLDKFNSKYTVE